MREGFLKYFPFGLLLISIFLIELFTIFNSDQLPFNDIDAINIRELIDSGASNTQSIGLYLYTDYFIIFQISGFLLLLAMIGAIVLAQNENQRIRNVSVFKQKNIDKKNIIKLN